MSPIDPVTLLRELRPPADARPDEDALERLLLAGAEPVPATRNRYVRPVAIAGTLAVVATAGIALAPSGGGPGVPGIVERAAAAMTKPDTILHYRAVTATRLPDRVRKERTIESWQTTDGRRERTIFDDGALESARNEGAQTFTTYNRERDEVLRHTDPDYFRKPESGKPAGLASTGFAIGITTVGDLPDLLRRARDGEAGVELVGRSEIRGIPVEQIRITRTLKVFDQPRTGERMDPDDLPAREVEATRDVYLRADDALPVRVVDNGPIPGSSDIVIDYLEAEQVPLDATTERLLDIGPHPGATARDEGPFK